MSVAEPQGNGPFVTSTRAEAARREAAQRLILAGVQRPSLTRISALAARLLGVESAQVSIVTDEQSAIGGSGVGASTRGSPLALSDSICALTVDTVETVAIEDAGAEALVARVPAVASGRIGSYLGAPLVVNDQRVGALCAYDSAPRTWSEADRELLETLAESVVAELELISLEATYAQDREVWQAAVDAAGVGAWDWDLASGALRYDARLLEIFGLDAETFGGDIEAFNQSLHPEDRDHVNSALERAIEDCGAYVAEYRIFLPSGAVRWIAAQGHGLAGPDGRTDRVVGAAYDITARRQAQLELEQLNRRSAYLVEATDLLTETLETEDAFQRLALLLVPDLCDWCIVSQVGSGATTAGDGWRRALRDVAFAHADPELIPLVRDYASVRRTALTDRSHVARALRSGRIQVMPVPAVNAILSALDDSEAQRLITELAPQHGVIVPLPGRGRPVGQLSMFRSAGREMFSADDLQLAQELALRIGVVLDNVRLYAEQRELAEKLQQSLLSEPHSKPGLQIGVRYVAAAEVAQVGGDWYDAFDLPDGQTMLVIGDVMGHDTLAAAGMGQIRGMLRGIAATSHDGPADVVVRLDAAMEVLGVETTATMALVKIDRSASGSSGGRMSWTSAGHPPPFLLRPSRSGRPALVMRLGGEEQDLLLGLDPSSARQEQAVDLEVGDLLLLYTDGLVERRTRNVTDGIAILDEVLQRLVQAPTTPGKLCDAVLAEMLRGLLEDDVAMVAMQVVDL